MNNGQREQRFNSSRPTFADGGLLVANMNDVAPITTGKPPVTRGMKYPEDPAEPKVLFEVPLSFQVRPNREKECRPDLPQTPHSAMVVGYADGSVRPVAGGIAPTRFWALVSPAGNEVVELP